MTSAAISRPLRALGLCATSLLFLACAAPPAIDMADDPAPNTVPGSAMVANKSTNNTRAQAIGSYRDYLARYPDGPERDRVTRRLADLLLEQGEDPTVYAEAINYYEYLLGAAPAGAQRTELLYQLSRAYQESGRSQQALASIDQLLLRETDADPRLYADTRFRQGELLFSEGDYLKAASAYRAVVELGPSVSAYESSLYKLGWSLFKQERYREALPPLLTSLDLKLAPVGENTPQAPVLSAASREQVADLYRVICASFAQLDGVDSVDSYFRQVGSRSYQQQVYLELAQWYVERQRISEAARTWLLVAQRDPLGAKAPRLTARAIELYRQAGFQQRRVATQAQFVTDYAMDSAFWRQHAPADFPAVMLLLQSSLQDLARLSHQQARDNADRAAAQTAASQAEQWYRQYLVSFGDTMAATEMNMQLAELLFERGDYHQAADEYERIARSSHDSTLAAEAALGALRAIDLALPDASAAENALLRERATTDALQFLQHYPEHTAAEDILVKTGTALLEQQQYVRALQVGKDAVSYAMPDARSDTLPTSIALQQLGWSLQAQALFAMANYTDATAAYREALLLADQQDERQPALLEGLAVATYRQAGQALTADDPQTALNLYRQAAQLAPTAGIRSKAQYDAATVLLSQASWTEAIAALQQFRAAYPDDPLQPEVTRRLAYALQTSGNEALAANEYLQLGQAQGQDVTVQREALRRAADLFMQAGDTDQAIATRESYLQRFPAPPGTAADVMQELADLESARGNAGRRRHWLQAIVALENDSPGAGTLGLAAPAALELAGYQLADFRELQLVDPVQESLARKIEAMKRALQAFETAIDYGVAKVTTAATYHIATMYDELGSALLSSPRPANLTAEQLAEYELLLANRAAGFEQQAIDLYMINTAGDHDAQRNPWVEKSVQQLKRRQAAR